MRTVNQGGMHHFTVLDAEPFTRVEGTRTRRLMPKTIQVTTHADSDLVVVHLTGPRMLLGADKVSAQDISLVWSTAPVKPWQDISTLPDFMAQAVADALRARWVLLDYERVAQEASSQPWHDISQEERDALTARAAQAVQDADTSRLARILTVTFRQAKELLRARDR